MQTADRNDFYVYLHTRRDTGEVFYVGKGRGRRAFNRSRFHRSTYWQRIVEKSGGFDVEFRVTDVSESEAFRIEVETIAALVEAGAKLCNLTRGGEGTAGWVKSPEWRMKVGAKHRGKVVSPEVRKKISDSVRACHYVPSQEARKKMSEAHRGKKRALGYRHTQEWKDAALQWKIGNKARTGQKMSPEERAKHSQALIGRPQELKVCPHCGTAGGNSMLRWHFDNCKRRVG